MGACQFDPGAEFRGDEAERQRLHNGAPLLDYRMPDYMLGSLFLHILASVYVTEQLENVAGYWHATWWFCNRDDEDTDAETWHYMADLHAYMFTVNAEAWRRFCAEENIAAAALTAGNGESWMWMLKHAEERMPTVAPTRDEIASCLRSHGFDDPHPVTADSLLARWRNTLNQMGGRNARPSGTGEYAS